MTIRSLLPEHIWEQVKGYAMKPRAWLLAATVLLISGSASAQQQYDSLGAPTPRPNQQTSPEKVEPNVPLPGGVNREVKPVEDEANTTGTTGPHGGTTGMAPPADTRTPADTGVTPGGLAPD